MSEEDVNVVESERNFDKLKELPIKVDKSI